MSTPIALQIGYVALSKKDAYRQLNESRLNRNTKAGAQLERELIARIRGLDDVLLSLEAIQAVKRALDNAKDTPCQS